MGIIDKITRRAKRAAGDIAGDQYSFRQGVEEERKRRVEQGARRRNREAAGVELSWPRSSTSYLPKRIPPSPLTLPRAPGRVLPSTCP
jgi:hypothetical protein